MRRLYTAGLTLYLAAQLPAFVLGGLRGKYDLRRRLAESFRGPVLPASERRGPAVWVHACSLGEVLAAAPLLIRLRERLPERRIVLSVVTRTGFEVAQKRLGQHLDGLFYFPFDLPGAVNRAFEAVRPGVVVIVETEIWPNFLSECHRRGVPVAWVNGRVSDRAFPRYRWARPLLEPLLAQAGLFVARTDEDARRIGLMGVPPERVMVAGNLKYDRGGLELEALREKAQRLDELLGLSGAPLIVAGSTTAPEEEIVLLALKKVRRREGLEAVRLLIAPRHPERAAEVATLIQKAGFSLKRRSQPSAGPAEVFLLDTVGELAAVYGLADAVFVGGSFSLRGGQSILEPALLSRSAVVGPHMENFREVLADFKAARAVVQVETDEPNEAARFLAEAWGRLLENPAETQAMGERARGVLERNSGATERTLAHLLPLIEAAPAARA